LYLNDAEIADECTTSVSWKTEGRQETHIKDNCNCIDYANHRQVLKKVHGRIKYKLEN